MSLRNYSNFQVKESNILGNKKIQSEQDAKRMVNHLCELSSKNQNMIFRGVNEAAYKMYTSSQRIFHGDKKCEYNQFLKTKIEQSKNWNNGIIRKYLMSLDNNSEDNNLAYFSIMQHYGMPTPFLDFTQNPYVALFFACNNVTKCYFDDNLEDLKNYISIYFIDPKYFNIKGLSVGINDLNLDSISRGVFQVNNHKIIYNNLNIIAQDGCFLINTDSELDLVSCLKDLKNSTDEKYFGCYNVNKSLAMFLLDLLKKKMITKESLFPDIALIS